MISKISVPRLHPRSMKLALSKEKLQETTFLENPQMAPMCLEESMI